MLEMTSSSDALVTLILHENMLSHLPDCVHMGINYYRQDRSHTLYQIIPTIHWKSGGHHFCVSILLHGERHAAKVREQSPKLKRYVYLVSDPSNYHTKEGFQAQK